MKCLGIKRFGGQAVEQHGHCFYSIQFRGDSTRFLQENIQFLPFICDGTIRIAIRDADDGRLH